MEGTARKERERERERTKSAQSVGREGKFKREKKGGEKRGDSSKERD